MKFDTMLEIKQPSTDSTRSIRSFIPRLRTAMSGEDSASKAIEAPLVPSVYISSTTNHYITKHANAKIQPSASLKYKNHRSCTASKAGS